MTRYLAFDLEIARDLPEGLEDWKSIRPLGITCAATITSEGELSLFPAKDDSGAYSDRMTPAQAGQMVDHLMAAVDSGLMILTWNGLGFDFDILAEESNRFEDCATLAMMHVDMMFHLFCLRGYGLALDKAAQGMGLPGKLPGMNGALAPQYWKDGKQGIVLDYVAQDVRTTLDVASAVEARRALRWVSMSGNEQFLRMPEGWLTVEQALKLPLPITTRMRNPWTRAKFTGWLDKTIKKDASSQNPSLPGMDKL
ncbi:MAG: hypothetical protein JW704_13055 [Anaerolineaceae bacterium]|nr:hypothetical protein [Anaerolineaceae bacterium]MBN2678153.1 hypothetical protein [Anaerolineaceae bacterium]